MGLLMRCCRATRWLKRRHTKVGSTAFCVELAAGAGTKTATFPPVNLTKLDAPCPSL